MFYSAAKFLTLLSVLFHAGIGCCPHHDHCWTVKSTPPVEERQKPQKANRCNCRFHAHGKPNATSENAGSDESDHDSCPCGDGHSGCSDQCSWLTNSKVELPANYGMKLTLVVADVWAIHASDSALKASGLSHAPPPISDSTDTRQARTQVWRL